MKKSAMARLQTRNRGTSILVRAKIRTNTTVPFPMRANKNTTQTPQRRVHQSNRSLHGKNGPAEIKMSLVHLPATVRVSPRPL